MHMFYKFLKLQEEQVDIFNNYLFNREQNGQKSFLHEVLWYRTQDEVNSEFSDYKNPYDKRRRVIHSLQNYVIEDGYLGINDFYLYLMISLPKDELDIY